MLVKYYSINLIQGITPNIYEHNRNAISTHPWWIVLRYRGKGYGYENDRRRQQMRRRYGYKRNLKEGLDSLDEYPFVSTIQWDLETVSVEAVPSEQQFVQGGHLSSFYSHRLKWAPRWFLVVPLPI